MPTLSVTKSYSAGNVLSASHLDAIRTSIQTFINSTKLDGDNIQISAIADDVGTAMSAVGANAIVTAATYSGSTYSGKLVGTTTNDDASTGQVGEYFEAKITSSTNFPTTTAYADAANLDLTAGDYDIECQLVANLNGATMTSFEFGYSTTSGNSQTGLVTGDNRVECLPPTSTANSGNKVSGRISVASATTYYLKVNATYSAGTPQYRGKISARRRR